MTFLSPDRLWLLVLVGVVGIGYLGSLVQQHRYAIRFTNVSLLDTVAPRRPGWRRHVAALAFLASLAALIVAYAQPADEVEVPRERATVMLAIDTSLSMEATDVEGSRIEAAKSAAVEFVDRLPPKINLGLVSFDGIARVRVTPTTDRDAVRRVIQELELGQATAIGEAIYASIDAFQDAPGSSDTPLEGDEEIPLRIVLMTDGQTTVGRPDLEGAQQAKDLGIQVSTIAFGTDRGVIQIEGEQGLTPVPVEESSLRDIATLTGGEFFRAESLTELENVYADIGSAVGFETIEQEVTDRFVGFGLALMILSAALSLIWFSRL
ncbi:MAG TPA: VWA domain-containing protein, partial [Acidimicrobiales bacterium]|nr:VWA domain-containing protein [Acidimicrobiales bacterium]